MSYKILVSLIAMVTVLASCANTEGGSGKFGLTGCATGALLGAAIGGITKGGKGAAIGAGAGCVAGSIAGYTVHRRTEKYASAQQALDKELAINEKSLNDLHKYNNSLAKKLKQIQYEIVAIKQNQASQESKRVALAQQKQAARQQYENAKNALDNANQDILAAESQFEKYQNQVASISRNKWRKQISILKKRKQILVKHIQRSSQLSRQV